jgi:hypothetical protein
LGSPLYEALLNAVADDIERSGPAWSVLKETVGDPGGSAVALRFMGAVHRLVLEGAALELAAFYPSAAGRVGPGVEDAFMRTVEEHEDRLRTLVREPVQTNEVRRSAALVGGFLEVARNTGMALRILELGASAGLNLRWDRYRYEARGETWGDPASPVRLCSFNSDTPLPFDVEAEVAARRGCDPAPVDPTSEEGRIRLTSFVWPDQLHRLRLLRAALEVAAMLPVEIDAEPAGAWLERRLEERHPGIATVVFHSIVFPYLARKERERVQAAVAAAGEAMGERESLAWLRMEPADGIAHVHLTEWPGGRERLVATAGFHGQAVRWLARS